MRLRLLMLAAGLALAPCAQAQGELGARWWVSSGETKLGHNAQILDPTLGNPTSVLVYGNLDANTLELFGRLGFGERWFLKGVAGFGDINRGSFDDEDFNVGQAKFSDTNSSVTQGRVSYGVIDFGRQWPRSEGGLRFGVFAGYSQWTENYDAYGATDFLGGIGGDIPHDVGVISNKVTWHALRAGVAADFVSGRMRFSVDAALIPYAKFRNEDSHHLRADLGPVPNIVDEGDGWGGQLDVELTYEIARRTEIGIGWRYWYLEARDGTTDFVNFNFAEEAPLVDFYTKRGGLLISLRRTW